MEEVEHVLLSVSACITSPYRSMSSHSSTCDLNISSAVGFTLSNPTIVNAALMLRMSWPCTNTGS